MLVYAATLVYAVALGVMAAADQNVDDSGTNAALTEFQYVLIEQQQVGTVVADVVSDAGLRRTLDVAVLDSLVFDVFYGLHSDLFDVDSPSGTVRVKRVVDRDVICYKRPSCVVPLDVAIVRPSTHFRVGATAPSLLTHFVVIIIVQGVFWDTTKCGAGRMCGAHRHRSILIT